MLPAFQKLGAWEGKIWYLKLHDISQGEEAQQRDGGKKREKGLGGSGPEQRQYCSKDVLKSVFEEGGLPDPGDRSLLLSSPSPLSAALSPPFYIPRAASEEGRREVTVTKKFHPLKKDPETQVEASHPHDCRNPSLPCCGHQTA